MYVVPPWLPTCSTSGKVLRISLKIVRKSSQGSEMAFPSARKMDLTCPYVYRAVWRSSTTSAIGRGRYFLLLYMLQNAHLFHGQPIVACTIRLWASHGGR